jgi:phosphoglucomutase/phosphomannomutase
MDTEGPDEFIFGTEESHGYLVGQYCRDKDGAVACMLMSQLAAEVKAQGKSLHQHMDDLYRKYGLHCERLINIQMEGSDGMKRMQRLMEKFRTAPPKSIGGLEIKCVRDFDSLKRNFPDGSSESFEGPQGNLLMFDSTEEGNYVAARPSGTEPKVKFYMFTYLPKENIGDLEADKLAMRKRLDAYAADMQAFADSV